MLTLIIAAVTFTLTLGIGLHLVRLAIADAAARMAEAHDRTITDTNFELTKDGLFLVTLTDFAGETVSTVFATTAEGLAWSRRVTAKRAGALAMAGR